jgi:hypothetical protein
MTGPGDESAARTAGRGHLLASHADREQVIDALKAAFVQDRLTKDEFDVRLGQALASRTYTELAALTADIPTGLAGAQPPRKPARARARPPLKKVVLPGVCVVIPPVLPVAAFLTGNEQLGKLSLLIMPWYFIAWIVAGLQMLDSWQKKRGCSP